MAKSAERIPKGEFRIIRDFVDHYENLQDACKRFENGKASALKDILMNLRSLIGKQRKTGFDGSLLRLFRRYGIWLDRPITNSDGSHGRQTFEQFLNHKCTLNSREIPYHEFLWELASQDASHSDDDMDPEYVMGEQVHIGGIPMNVLIIQEITHFTSEACATMIKDLKNRFPDLKIQA